MICISRRHTFKYAFQYKHRLRENVKVGAPPLIIEDLKRLYLYHLKRLLKNYPDMIHLLSVFQGCKQLSVNPDDFRHKDCGVCTRKIRYVRACNNYHFRCKNVAEEFEKFKMTESTRIREEYCDVDNVIEIYYPNGMSMFWVGCGAEVRSI